MTQSHRLLPGLVAHLFHAGAQADEGFAVAFLGGHVQKLREKDIQVARRTQAAGQNLGAAAQIAQPVLLEFLAEGLEHDFQPPQGDAQLMQAFHRTARAQGRDIGRHLRQAIRQSGAESVFRTHAAADAGGPRLDRLGGAQAVARQRMNGSGARIVHAREFRSSAARMQEARLRHAA